MPSPSPFLQTTLQPDGLLVLTMTQPGKKNAMNAAMRDALAMSITTAATDPQVRALLLTGADGSFSAGGDIQGLMTVEPADFRAYLQRGHALVRALWTLEKPSVAAIEGVGVGGGLALAMCCDSIVMGRGARIGFTFARIGFVPDWGTIFTVARRIGTARAEALFLGADLLDAARALEIGLVDQVVDDGTALSTAMISASKLASLPAGAFAATKRLLRALPGTLEAALEEELAAQDSRFKSPEFLDGVQRFLK